MVGSGIPLPTLSLLCINPEGTWVQVAARDHQDAKVGLLGAMHGGRNGTPCQVHFPGNGPTTHSLCFQPEDFLVVNEYPWACLVAFLAPWPCVGPSQPVLGSMTVPVLPRH